MTLTAPTRLLLFLAAAGCLTAPQAQASWEATNAAGTCQGALPAFAGTLRARPLALGNEGGSPAFVTCSINAGEGGPLSKAILDLYATVVNNGGSSATINCTLVEGTVETATYLAKSMPLPAGMTGQFVWTPSELPGGRTSLRQPNLSCSLPPGAAIHWIGYDYIGPTM